MKRRIMLRKTNRLSAPIVGHPRERSSSKEVLQWKSVLASEMVEFKTI